MLVPPAGGVGRIHPDHGDATPGGHRGEPGAEPAGEDSGHGAAQPFPPLAAAQVFPAGRPRVGEVKILHHDRRTAAMLGLVEQAGDRRAQPAITARRGQSLGAHLDRCRVTDRVTRGVEHTTRQMVGVEIHPEHPASTQLLEGRRGFGCGLPGRVQIPAAPLRIEADVIAHRLPRRDPVRPLLAAVGEPHWGIDHYMRAQLIG